MGGVSMYEGIIDGRICTYMECCPFCVHPFRIARNGDGQGLAAWREWLQRCFHARFIDRQQDEYETGKSLQIMTMNGWREFLRKLLWGEYTRWLMFAEKWHAQDKGNRIIQRVLIWREQCARKDLRGIKTRMALSPLERLMALPMMPYGTTFCRWKLYQMWPLGGMAHHLSVCHSQTTGTITLRWFVYIPFGCMCGHADNRYITSCIMFDGQ